MLSQRVLVGIILVGRLGVAGGGIEPSAREGPFFTEAAHSQEDAAYDELRGSQGRGFEHRSTEGLKM